jgi:SAM-dependent methyltransferase
MAVREASDVYATPAVEWQTRLFGTHLHPGAEEATVALAERAAHYGLREGGLLIDLASALGGPARFIARRFAATVICVDVSHDMQTALISAAQAEGLARRCLPVLARIEHLPFASASCGGAWSQDALCHMEKRATLAEIARVLLPGAVFAFTDFIARSVLSSEDSETLAREWGFRPLPRLVEYTGLLDQQGFEVLLAEDRTRAVAAQYSRAKIPDQGEWEIDFATRHGGKQTDRLRAIGDIWLNLLRAERTGYGMFICRRR